MARIMTGASAGLTLRYVGGAGRFMGRSPAEALMAACTSRAGPSTLRSRLNWILIAAPPKVLTEVISETPEIWPRRRSSGAARVEATVAGSAPGKFAETVIMGKSTRGIGATGRKWEAITPARNNADASSEVPAGRRMNGSEMLMGEGTATA